MDDAEVARFPLELLALSRRGGNDRTGPTAWTRIGAGLLLVLVYHCAAAVNPPRSPPVAEQPTQALWVGAPVTQQMQWRQTHHYTFTAPAPGPWLLSVQQHGINLVVTVAPPGADPVARTSPLGDFAVQTQILHGDTNAPVTITVRSRELGRPPAEYTLRLDALAPPPARQAILRTHAALARGDAHFQRASSGAWDKAASAYADGIELAQLTGDPVLIARAQASRAAAVAVIGSLEEAIALYEAARQLFLANRQPLMAAVLQAHMGRAYSEIGQYQSAAQTLTDADTALAKHSGTERERAFARHVFCTNLIYQRKSAQSLDCLLALLEHPLRKQDVTLNAQIQMDVGNAYRTVGDAEQGRAYLERSLDLLKDAERPRIYSSALNNMAVLERHAGHLELAISLYLRSIALDQAVGEINAQAVTMSNVGTASMYMGKPEQAVSFFHQALQLNAGAGDTDDEALYWSRLNWAYLTLGQFEQAEHAARNELALRGRSEIHGAHARALTRLGQSQTATGALAEGERNLRRALQELAPDPSPTRADALKHLGSNLLAQRQFTASEKMLEQALNVYEVLDDSLEQLALLNQIARTRLHRGLYLPARTSLDRAQRISDRVSGQLSNPAANLSLLGALDDIQSLRVPIEISLGNSAEDGLLSNDQRLAKSLVRLMSQAERDAGRPLTAHANAQLQALEREVETVRVQLDQLSPQAPAQQRLDVQSQLDLALTRLQSAEAQYAPAASLSADALEVPLDNVATMQAMLNTNTVLLHYHVTGHEAFVWLVQPDNVVRASLGPGEPIRQASRKFHESLRAPIVGQRCARDRWSIQLSEMLLAPVVEHLGDARILVVADGALALVPFAALHDPAARSVTEGCAVPLIAQHEVVYVPSMSTLALQRSQPHAGDTHTSLSIFADPVVDAADPRLAQAPAPNSQAPASVELRLPGTGREADAIARVAEALKPTVFRGLDADRGQVLNGVIDHVDIVHFATHGLVDTRNPQYSSLMLSTHQADGSISHGELRFRDIFQLDLHASLVVLSGCETGLGREVGSAGLASLTRSFMYAGAQRVISSLWRIDDNASAALMAEFYEQLIGQRQRPAYALRHAQLALMAQPRWQDSYYWAAFTLQGEWR